MSNTKTKNENVDVKEDFFTSLVRPCIRKLEPYNPGEMPQNCVRLCANESSRGVSPKVSAAMKSALLSAPRYPDSTCLKLRTAIAKKYEISPDGVIVGNGLDGIFTMLGRTFLSSGDEVISADITFSVYLDTAAIMGCSAVKIPLNDRMEFDADSMINAVTEKTKMIFWCNPNNPTGTLVPLAEIVRVIETVPKNVLFILDEAYIEFAENPESGMPLTKKYPNLIVCRTFSKIHGLAGVRIGFAAAHPMLIKQMYRTREPYCVSDIAQAGALEALADVDYFNVSRRLFIKERRRLESFFTEMGTDFIPSQGNFILLTGNDAENIYQALAEKNIITRLLNARGKKMLRITVGTEEENNLLIKYCAIF